MATRVHDLIVRERRSAARLLSGLPADRFGAATLCHGWTVHDIAAHLVSYLRFGQAKLYRGIVTTAADFDRVNLELTRRWARRPVPELAALLDRRAASRVTIPRAGYDPVLADLVLHDLDLRLPLGLDRPDDTEESWWVTFRHLTTAPALGFGVRDRLHGLRVQADDTGWSAGTGAPVRGPARDVLLGISGRPAGLDALSGDGVPLLRARLAGATLPPPARRLAAVLRTVVRPAPAARRSRDAVADPPR